MTINDSTYFYDDNGACGRGQSRWEIVHKWMDHSDDYVTTRVTSCQKVVMYGVHVRLFIRQWEMRGQEEEQLEGLTG